MFRVLKPGRFAMIEFNNRDPELFDGIKAAALNAGFIVRNMLPLDKDQKSFKQVQGILRGEGTLDKDVYFNIEKPSFESDTLSRNETDLEHQVADAVRKHLLSLPSQILAEPVKYSDEHRNRFHPSADVDGGGSGAATTKVNSGTFLRWMLVATSLRNFPIDCWICAITSAGSHGPGNEGATVTNRRDSSGAGCTVTTPRTRNTSSLQTPEKA